MKAGIIRTGCLACGARVVFAISNGRVEFECQGAGRHVFEVPEGRFDDRTPVLMVDELYRRVAPRGLGLADAGAAGEPIGRLCPVCGAAMTVERGARRGVFRCSGAAEHCWEIEGADMWRAPVERCFDLVAELAPFSSGRRVS